MEPTGNDTTARFAPVTPPAAKRPAWLPTGPAWMVYALVVLLAIAVTTNTLWFLLAHPAQGGNIAAAGLTMVGFAILFSHADRIRKLERDPKTSRGPMEQMILDALAAARLAGSTETQAQAIASEILATTVRNAGGWRAS